MSYEKVKTITLNEKENKIYITSAVNNIRPLYYSKWELKFKTEKTYEEKLKELFRYIMWNEFQLYNSVRQDIRIATNKVRDRYYYEMQEEDFDKLFQEWKSMLGIQRSRTVKPKIQLEAPQEETTITVYLKTANQEEYVLTLFKNAEKFLACCNNTKQEKLDQVNAEYMRIEVEADDFNIERKYNNIYSLRKFAKQLVNCGL